MLRSRLVATVLALSVMGVDAVRAGSPESVRYQAWHACLHDSFTIQAALSSRTLAADAALRDCRASENAYLDALAASPLLDGEDVARVRPALLVKAKDRLLGPKGVRPL